MLLGPIWHAHDYSLAIDYVLELTLCFRSFSFHYSFRCSVSWYRDKYVKGVNSSFIELCYHMLIIVNMWNSVGAYMGIIFVHL